MRRVLLLLCVVAACGDNLDDVGAPGGETTPPIEAVCDEGQLDSLVAGLPNVTKAQPTACGDYVQAGVT